MKMIGKLSKYIVIFLISLIGIYSCYSNEITYASGEDSAELHVAEVIYNVLSFKNGEIRYTIQAWVNEEYIVSRVANSEVPQLRENIKGELTGLKIFKQGLRQLM